MSRFEKTTRGRFSGQIRPLPSKLALTRQASTYNELQRCLVVEPCHDLENIYGCEPDCLADFEDNPWVDPGDGGEDDVPKEDVGISDVEESEEIVEVLPEVEAEEAGFTMADAFGGEEEIIVPPYLAASSFAPPQAATECFSSCFVDEFPVSKREASTVSLEIEPVPVFVPPPLVTSRSRTMFDVLRATRRQALVDSVERARACPVRVVAPIVEEDVTASDPSV